MQKPSLPKGTRDFGPGESAKRKYITGTIEKYFTKYGFQKIETPSLENLSVLTGKYGDEGDQLLFKILNSGDYLKNVREDDLHEGSKHLLPKIAEKGLRYDLTVPFARYVVMNQHNISFPFKRYQIQPVWRADRPQKGRYREFYQCDADIIGTNNMWNETELTLLIHDIFLALGLEDFVVKINHREILSALAGLVGMKGREEEFCVELDKLDKTGKDHVVDAMVKSGAEKKKVTDLLEIFETEGSNIEKIKIIESEVGPANGGVKQLNELLQLLGEQPDRSNKVEIDFSLARGLSYYTGVIFEVKTTSMQMGSLCGGGRYDNLAGVFGLPNVSGVGISFGLDRIYDVMEALGLFPKDVTSGLKVLITHFDEDTFRHGRRILDELRGSGIQCDIYPEIAKLKKQLNYANRIGTEFVITIGDREMESGKYAFKNMESGDQTTRTIQDIIHYFTAKD